MNHEKHLRQAIEVAKMSLQKGNLLYGCILVDSNGSVVLTGENTVNTSNDLIAHAEINLIRQASNLFDLDFLKTCTIYTSDEPCSMCSSAIYWSGIKQLVFGLSKSRFYAEFGRENPDWDFEISATDILSKGARKTEIIGPLMEEEMLELHRQTQAKSAI